MNPLFLLFAVMGGMLNTVQSDANAQLRKSLDQPVLSGAIVYLTGLAGLLLILVFANFERPSAERLAGTPWWAWLGGLLSIASTMAGLMLARKLGSAVFTSLSLTSALVTSVALDHLGWVGFEIHRANPLRLIGCGLMIAGIFLISKF